MKANDVIALLLQHGWYQERQQGSHRIFKHPDYSFNISVPFHGNKDLATGTLRDLLKKAGIKIGPGHK